MPVKTEKELGEPLRSLWLKVVAAIELRNLGYAISLLQGILKQEPEFLTGRQLLRRAEVTKHQAEKRGFFNVSTSTIAIMKAQRELKRDPRRAVEMIEKILENEPYNRQANLVLKEAALAAGWPEIAVFALQTLLEEKARDTKKFSTSWAKATRRSRFATGSQRSTRSTPKRPGVARMRQPALP
jgi:predicted Zn-dependent protease